MIHTILLIMMKRHMFLGRDEAKDERHLGTICLGGIMMKRNMVLDQGEIKNDRSLGTTHLEEIRCGGRL